MIKPFKVDFSNLVISGTVVEIEEKGILVFKDINNVKWEYLEPDHKVWILQGDKYEFYDEEDEQVTKGELDKKAQLWLWQILLNREESENNKMEVDINGREIRFYNDEDGIDFKILISKDLLPYKVIQKDPSGVDIVYIFSNYKKNVELSDDDFKLKTNGKVDIIELN